MFSTMINMPIWAAVLVAIFYGLMGALITVLMYRKNYKDISATMESLADAYDDLDAEYDRLLSFYTSHSNSDIPSCLYVPKVFDLKDHPTMVDVSFALRFKRGEDIGKLINLIEENYRSDQIVTMRDILDFCYCPSCADDVYFGWKVSDILEQYRCIQEIDDDPDSYWRMKLPTPHVIDPDLFPYPVEIVFYDPEDFLKRYEDEHKEEPMTPPSESGVVMVPLIGEAK